MLHVYVPNVSSPSYVCCIQVFSYRKCFSCFRDTFRESWGLGLGAKGWGALRPGAADGAHSTPGAVDGRVVGRRAALREGWGESLVSYGWRAASERTDRAGHPGASASGTYANSSAHNITSPMTLVN